MQLHTQLEKNLIQDYSTFKTKIFYHLGGQLSYDDTGESVTARGLDSKQRPVIVCIPGAGDTRAQYRYLLPVLKSYGFRVICCDIRGMGNSSTQWNTCRPVDIAKDIEHLLKHLKVAIRRGCALIAHGESAAVSIHLASKRPDLVRSITMLSPVIRCEVWDKMLLPLKNASTWYKYYKSLYGKKSATKPLDHGAYMSMIKLMLKDEMRCSLLVKYLTSPNGLTEGKISRVRCPVFLGKTLHSSHNGLEWIQSNLSFQVPIVETKSYDCGHFPHLSKFTDVGKDLSKWIDKNSAPIWQSSYASYEIMKNSRCKVLESNKLDERSNESIIIMD